MNINGVSSSYNPYTRTQRQNGQNTGGEYAEGIVLPRQMKEEISNVPYGGRAKDGKIVYNNVTFECCPWENAICLGDMQNEDQIIDIPLSGGGTLKLNRLYEGDLTKAMGMFTPEDISRILKSLADAAKANQVMLGQEEEENKILGDGRSIEIGMGTFDPYSMITRKTPSQVKKDINESPYGWMAKDGKIGHNGVVFGYDSQNNVLSLGDVDSDKSKVLNIPLSGGTVLKVNRDNLGDLSKALGMFSPEDVNLIMRAIAQDTKLQQMQMEIEDDKNSIGDSADSEELLANAPDKVKEAWERAREEVGADGFSQDMPQLTLERFLGAHESYGTILGDSAESAETFARKAVGYLEEYKRTHKEGEGSDAAGQELAFYHTFLKYLSGAEEQ